MSREVDPYSLQEYPLARQIILGKQAHNVRELVKAAKAKGQYLDMYRQPIPENLVREIIKRYRATTPHRTEGSEPMTRNEAQKIVNAKYSEMVRRGMLVGKNRKGLEMVREALIARYMGSGRNV